MLVASPQRYCGVKWGNAVPLGIPGTNYNNDGDSGGGSGDENRGKQWHQHREACRNAIPGNAKSCRAAGSGPSA